MRSNFRPNARLIINIFILIATSAIAVNLMAISRSHKFKNICADFLSKEEYSDNDYIDTGTKLGIYKDNKNFSIVQFCSFY
tara:strand:+ start:897 stop:1139 length:243 start_codon:yes stop_codon:yes gene_type:complete